MTVARALLMAPAFAGRIRLREALLHPAAPGYPIIVVDMSGTHFCGPAGRNVLVRTCTWAVAEGGELRLVLLTGAMRRMLAVTGLDCPNLDFRNVADAIADLPAASIEPRRSGRPASVDHLAAVLARDTRGARLLQAGTGYSSRDAG
jgi:anti-anti-sigma regulatory factor